MIEWAMRFFPRHALPAALACLWTVTAAADLRAEENGLGGTFTLQLENDKFVGTDRHYTHGTRLAWVWDDEARVPGWIGNLMERAYFFSTPKRKQLGLAVGQNIYTPEDTLSTGLIADDRPYAGWSYLGLSLHAEVDTPLFSRRLTALDTVELNFGLVGPQSYAREAQNTIHRTIGTDEAQGWDHQLKNEPTINLTMARKWRLPLYGGKAEDRYLAWDALPHLGASAGNVLTNANAGFTLRFGHDLKRDYGPPQIQPNLPGRASFDTFEDSDALGWYLFAGAEGRYVARNIFLDGNTFADSPSVTRIPWTADLRLGAVVTYGRVRIALVQALRTREFEGQRQDDRFGALTMTVRF